MQVRVIGAHLPRLDQEGISHFIREDVARFKKTLYELSQEVNVRLFIL
jgi:hypothetical protein